MIDAVKEESNEKGPEEVESDSDNDAFSKLKN